MQKSRMLKIEAIYAYSGKYGVPSNMSDEQLLQGMEFLIEMGITSSATISTTYEPDAEPEDESAGDAA